MSDRSLLWSERFLEQWRAANEIAVRTDDTQWSGHELLERASGALAWLTARGFEHGRSIPAIVEESPATIALVVGGALGGRPLAPLGPRLTHDELAGAAKASGSAGLVTTPDHRVLADTVASIAGLHVHVLEGVPDRTELAIDVTRADPNDTAVVVHTSGTTGAPRPVAVRQRALLEKARIYDVVMPIGRGDVYCSASPLHHTAGVTMMLTVLARGATVIPQARFSIEGWRAAARLGVTHAMLVPTMIDILLEAGALGAARPRVLQYGAAPIDLATLTDAMAVLTDVEFLQIFGQTEISPITVLTHADHVRGLEEPDLLSTVGRPPRGVELRIEGPDARGIGEIIVRAAHACVVDADGWRRTGDLGAIDANGYLRLHGRVNDRIVRGGENIYPVEVERALASHPLVRDVAVVGVTDRRYGETVKAFVVPIDPASPPSLDDLRAHARALLAPFKIPAIVELVDQLPRTPGGKLLRRELGSRDD